MDIPIQLNQHLLTQVLRVKTTQLREITYVLKLIKGTKTERTRCAPVTRSPAFSKRRPLTIDSLKIDRSLAPTFGQTTMWSTRAVAFGFEDE